MSINFFDNWYIIELPCGYDVSQREASIYAKDYNCSGLFGRYPKPHIKFFSQNYDDLIKLLSNYLKDYLPEHKNHDNFINYYKDNIIIENNPPQ